MKTPSALLLAGIVFAGLACVMPAQASIYANPPDLGSAQNGQCSYNVVCGGTGYAAQEFTLAAAATIGSVGFNSIVLGSGQLGTAANYKFLAANGAGGLPGSLLASGFGTALSATAGPVGALFATTDYSFAITPLALAAGSYYVSFQEITTNGSDFLSRGVAASGGAQSLDGGATWFTGYGGFQSVAVSLNAVPEPATFTLLGTGMLGLAFGLARRRA